ncbi:hypothetical protein [Priestia megaterium]|uniref:hypothetical protein n=1 Tax=Priestia megaterium TaxID=1404 RepID=UPI00177D0CB2|nr:hypothetical protein [Priestia megaterium]MBD8848405.1 hypothetical protein [Priestia megaterium]
MKQKQTFTRGTIYNSEGKTITFVVNFWQDKNDKKRIWMASKDILVPTEINNHPNSVNYHPKLFSRLKELLINEDRWN